MPDTPQKQQRRTLTQRPTPPPSPRDADRRQPERSERPPLQWGRILFFALIVWLVWSMLQGGPRGREIGYSQFKQYLEAGKVETANVGTERIHGRIDPTQGEPLVAPGSDPTPAEREGEQPADRAEEDALPTEPFDYQTVRIEDDQLLEQLSEQGVRYRGVAESPFSGLFLIWLLPLLLFPLILLMMARARGGGPGGGPMGSPFGFGRSRARLAADKDTGVTFGDVAGCDEAKADLAEVVEFLKHPDRFAALGAKIPKGVLLLGPPGTGKTLLARAVAGEAGVPFFSISGSEFVEMFVGVGAARVRDLFEQAKKTAPCIVFVDEIDAIGRARGVQMGAVNDEREQTLNQLLVELDGFEPNSGVILIAATNRPDVLDRALLRPGRFDRQVVLDAPDFEGRKAILRVHARGKPLADDVDLAVIARGTPGFSGADLANALNEAALLGSRRGAEKITQHDLEEAIEKIVAGPERQSRRLRDQERRRVAFHEAGHALVARYCEFADPVHKISIVPRGRAALGYTMQLPLEEQMLMTEQELEDRIVGLLGGRAAEETVLGNVSTGASDDLERATGLARQMVCVFGMGEAAGLMRCARDADSPFLRGPGVRLERDCSEATARAIDEEVKKLLATAYGRATGILGDHRTELEKVAEALLERERLDSKELEEVLEQVAREARVER